MKLRLSISTCPNDTFMFDAMIHRRIDTEGLEFEPTLCDIERLNAAAFRVSADITKLSYAVVPKVIDRYKILNSGSALGRGNGPLLVSRHKIYPDELRDARIAIPGEHTTANRLMDLLYPEAENKRAYLFSDIAEAVMSDECDAGVLIHEGRFTYRDKGLKLIADLGEEWEKRTMLPLPLGAIAVSRSLDQKTQRTIDRVLRRSIAFAFENPSASAGFVRQYARELSEDVVRRHIELFVNAYSLDLGEEGRRAVVRLLELENEEAFV